MFILIVKTAESCVNKTEKWEELSLAMTQKQANDKLRRPPKFSVLQFVLIYANFSDLRKISKDIFALQEVASYKKNPKNLWDGNQENSKF